MSTVAAEPTLSWSQELQLQLLALCAAGKLWITLSSHGVGLSPDSVGYLAVARHITEGVGFVSYRGEPFVSQPPLYPLVLAGLMRLFNLETVTAALYLNVALYAFVVYLSGRISFSMTKSFTMAIFVCLLVFFSVKIFTVSIFAWSELLFIVLLIIHLHFINKFTISNGIGQLALAAFFIGLLCLTRYAGVVAILSSLVFILFTRENNIKIILYRLTIFSIISSLLFILWIFRNYIRSGTLLGPRTYSVLKVNELLILFGDVIIDSFICQSSKLEYSKWFICCLLALFIFFSILIFSLIWNLVNGNINFAYQSMFAILYSIFIIISSRIVFYDPIDQRLLSPVFIPFIIPALYSFSKIVSSSKLYRALPNAYRRSLVVLWVVGWFTYPSIATTVLAIETYQNGQGYHADHWQHGETIRYLQKHRADFYLQPIYTNDPEGLYFLAGIYGNYLSSQARAPWPRTEQAYLIRFERGYPGNYLDQVERMKNFAEITSILKFSDGEIYYVKRKSDR